MSTTTAPNPQSVNDLFRRYLKLNDSDASRIAAVLFGRIDAYRDTPFAAQLFESMHDAIQDIEARQARRRFLLQEAMEIVVARSNANLQSA